MNAKAKNVAEIALLVMVIGVLIGSGRLFHRTTVIQHGSHTEVHTGRSDVDVHGSDVEVRRNGLCFTNCN
jgi:hypothetical protein